MVLGRIKRFFFKTDEQRNEDADFNSWSYFKFGEYKKAEKYEKRCLALKEKVFGNEHVEVAKSLNKLGAITLNKASLTRPSLF